MAEPVTAAVLSYIPAVVAGVAAANPIALLGAGIGGACLLGYHAYNRNPTSETLILSDTINRKKDFWKWRTWK